MSENAAQICSNYAAYGGAGIQRGNFYLWDGNSWVGSLDLADYVMNSQIAPGEVGASPAGANFYSDGDVARAVTAGGELQTSTPC